MTSRERDVVLASGESFRLDHPELAIVQAFDTAEILVVPPVTRTPGSVREKLSSWLAHALSRNPQVKVAAASTNRFMAPRRTLPDKASPIRWARSSPCPARLHYLVGSDSRAKNWSVTRRYAGSVGA